MVGERTAAQRRELVKSPSPLVGLLHPAPFHQTLALQAVEHRVDRGDLKLECLLRLGFDEFGQFVAVTGSRFQQGEQDHLGAATLKIVCVHISASDICIHTIYMKTCYVNAAPGRDG